MIAGEQAWIAVGYERFALDGEDGLKIEPMARRVGVSKSSFYHHFADLELYVEKLLNYHLVRAKIMLQKERTATCIDPDLIHILIEHKTDLLFNRQLRILQQRELYRQVLATSNAIFGHEFVSIWAKDLKLNLNTQQLSGLYELAVENFFIQINSENLHYEWLSQYFRNLKRIARTMA